MSEIQVSEIKVQLPDGSVKVVPQGTTAYDVAKSISPRLADAALVAETAPMNDGDKGTLIDLARPLESDVRLRLLTEKDPEALEVFHHSSAHLLAAAVLELFPETKLGHGPATENGFFYDFMRETPFTPEDLEKIEKKMQEIVQRNEPFAREFMERDKGLQQFKAEGDFMKCHFIEQFVQPGEKVSLYKTGKFVDFCRGPHIPSTGKIKAFKLLNIAGAYWLGKEGNPQLQRIYGTSFFSKKDLDEYLKAQEEAKRRDHRTLGKQLDLFSIQELAGPGLIFWHPKGGLIRTIMEDWLRQEYQKRGYSLVFTPHVARRQLWQTSGHEGFYAENMFTTMELDDAEYRMKPMNCPFHILIYKDQLRSYRDLPVRLGELGTVYRYERSGVMHGLMRVRGFTQDDAHIFCTPQQIESEIDGCIDFAESVLHTYGFNEYKVELSEWDPNDRAHYVGSEDQWKLAQDSLKNVLNRKGIPYKCIPGEAAFYGPKIDVKLVDAIGRLWQLSTVQFDFNLPQRFELEYVGEDGQRHQPLMVHRALYGSVERFFGVLIEHYAGAFPLWLSPVQVALVPIAERHAEYANKVGDALKAIGARVEVDARNEKMNAKIREHALQKVPFILVVGDKEAEAGEVNVRVRGQEKAEGSMKLEAFIDRVKRLNESKSTGLD
ncbi:MAG TPA: threonine--tRNA ligase [Candidatus Acidoferrales bacterium]|nr:threonine--tRNA ligase [Candidatus Acidoferrales bacterium]